MQILMHSNLSENRPEHEAKAKSINSDHQTEGKNTGEGETGTVVKTEEAKAKAWYRQVLNVN